MEKMEDWSLKFDVVRLVDFFQLVREETVYMLQTNRWILTDVNLLESFCQLQEMIEASNQDLNDFIQEVKQVEKESKENISLKEHLQEEFENIRETIHLEASYITNMIEYMCIVDDYTLDPDEMIERLDEYDDKDFCCYQQIKINQEQLKQLKKERKDVF